MSSEAVETATAAAAETALVASEDHVEADMATATPLIESPEE